MTRTCGGFWAPPRCAGRPSGRPGATCSSSASAVWTTSSRTTTSSRRRSCSSSRRRAAGHGGAQQVVEPQPQSGAERDPHVILPGDSERRHSVDHLGWDPVRGAAAVRHPDPGPHAAHRAEEPAAGGQPDGALPARAGARPRHLRPGRSAAGQPPAAAHRRPPRRPEQRQRESRQVLLLSQARGLLPVRAPVRGVDEFKLRGAYGQTGNRALFGAHVLTDTIGTIGGNFGHLHRDPGG